MSGEAPRLRELVEFGEYERSGLLVEKDKFPKDSAGNCRLVNLFMYAPKKSGR